MQQIYNVWTNLEPRRRILVLISTLAVFASVLMLSRMAATPTMSLLFAGLESGAAGGIVSSLEQRGVAYEVRGGSIFVEATRRDELRMTLASEGLPENSGKGYELLDNLSGFGTTSQMFDAAYWRAKEGELARTIVSSPQVLNARVHIANTGANPFRRDVQPTASVSVNAAGGSLSGSHAKALRYLVASAVPGLQPENVAIIDGKGGLVGVSEDSTPNTDPEDRASALRDRVQRLMEARVGYGNAVVEVSVETVTESESIRERHFDPESRVAISTDTEERSNQSSDTAGGDVTVASNLADGDAGGGDKNSSQNSETRERVNYEVSETEREILRAPGAIKRVSVAVLVNGKMISDENGQQVFMPLAEEELSALKELVSSAVGYDQSRGDVITIKSMVFEPVVPLGAESVPSMFGALNLDVMSLVQMAVLALVALVLGLFVVRPVLSSPAAVALPAPGPSLPGADRPQTEQDPSGLTPLTGEIDDGDFDGDRLPVVSHETQDNKGAGQSDQLNQPDPVERLRNLIGERQEETVEILRSWLDDREEKV